VFCIAIIDPDANHENRSDNKQDQKARHPQALACADGSDNTYQSWP